MARNLDLTGQRFGRLVAVSVEGTVPRVWRCVCDCGATVVAAAGTLRYGSTKSCGCLQRDRASETSRTHGDSRRNPREYRVWRIIKSRCTNPNFPSYADYGARGIGMCQRWAESYSAFLADMGRCPEGSSIDRIEVDGNYEPGNCRWATASVQAKNKRTYRSNKTGFRGVCMRGTRFHSQISSNSKKHSLGTFDTLDQAVATRLAAEERLWCGVSREDQQC